MCWSCNEIDLALRIKSCQETFIIGLQKKEHNSKMDKNWGEWVYMDGGAYGCVFTAVAKEVVILWPKGHVF